MSRSNDSRRPSRVIAVAFAVTLTATSCGDDANPCAPHGWLEGDLCTCALGFEPAGLACVPASDGGSRMDAAFDAALDGAPDDASLVDAMADAPSCRRDGPCTTDAVCCLFCHIDHCH